MVYYRNRYEDFAGAVRHLLENKKDRERMGRKACETILKEWNADTAAARCLSLYEGWEKGRMVFPESGPPVPRADDPSLKKDGVRKQIRARKQIGPEERGEAKTPPGAAEQERLWSSR